MSFTSSSSYNIRPRFFPVVSSKKPKQGVVGNCVPHRAPTSPLRAYITRMELNREHGGSPGRAPCSQLAGSGHAGRGNTSAQPRTTHSLFLINRRATISQCLGLSQTFYKLPDFWHPLCSPALMLFLQLRSNRYDQVTNYLDMVIFFLKKLLWGPRRPKIRDFGFHGP